MREALGIAAGNPVLLSSAWNVDNHRKGWPLLMEALVSSQMPMVMLLQMGSLSHASTSGKVIMHSLGQVADDRVKMLAYNAADVFVNPTLAESFGNTFVEAMACGTPSLAFDIAPMPDLVREGQTGWLARGVSAESLRERLIEAIEDVKDGNDYREQSRAVAEAEYDAVLQARRYEEVFRSLL